MNPYQYIVGRLISGEGGQADIYHLTRRSDRKVFAGKFPKEMFARDPEVIRRADREAGHYQRLHALTPHSHVVRMVETINWEGRKGIVLELMEASFERRLERGIGDPEKIRAIREAALGLAHLHRYGITHRDMKPSNLLRAFDGRYVVADLGCATASGTAAINLTRASIGTPALMAPEQHGPHFYADARTDLYLLGICISRAFLGSFPETSPVGDGESYQVQLSTRMGELDQEFQELLWRCLHPSALERYHSMEEFIGAWDALAAKGVLKTPETFLQKVVKGAVFVGLCLAVLAAIRGK